MVELREVIGQARILGQLIPFLELFAVKRQPLQHIMLIGAEGMGKVTIARALGAGRTVQEVKAEDLQQPGDLTAILANVSPGQFLVLSNLHLLRSGMLPLVASAMSSYKVTITIGKRNHSFEIPYFTLVGTVPKQGDCPQLLRQQFSLNLELENYSVPELKLLAIKIAGTRGISIPVEAADLFVRFANTPGKLDSIIGRVAKICSGSVTHTEVAEVLSAMGMLCHINAVPSEFEALQTLSGQQFESLIAQLLWRLGFRTKLTAASGDGGIDVIATLDEPIVGGRYLFQCKRFAPEIPIGAPIVRDFFGALSADRIAVKGVVITTSTFTEQARSFAQSVGVELIDGEMLVGLLRKYDIAFQSTRFLK